MKGKNSNTKAIINFAIIFVVIAGVLSYAFLGVYKRDTENMTRQFVLARAATVRDIHARDLFSFYRSRDDLALMQNFTSILEHEHIVKAELINEDGSILASRVFSEWNNKSDFSFPSALKNRRGWVTRLFIDEEKKIMEYIAFVDSLTGVRPKKSLTFITNVVEDDVFTITTNEETISVSFTNQVFLRLGVNKLLYDRYINQYNTNLLVNLLVLILIAVAAVFAVIIFAYNLPLKKLKTALAKVSDKPAVPIEYKKVDLISPVVDLVNIVIDANNNLREIYEHQLSSGILIPNNLLDKAKEFIEGGVILFNHDNKLAFFSEYLRDKLDLEYGKHILDLTDFSKLIEDSENEIKSIKVNGISFDVERIYDDGKYFGILLKAK